MDFLSNALDTLPEYKEACALLEGGGKAAALFGLTYIHRIIFAADFVKTRGKKLLFIAPDEAEAEKAEKDFNCLGIKAVLFPSRDYSLRSAVKSLDFEHKRMNTLPKLLGGAFELVVTTPEAVIQKTMPRSVLESYILSLSTGDEIKIEDLVKRLLDSGYVKSEKIDGIGQFSVRGSIVDIFSPFYDSPIRIDFWGDDIDSISFFDIESQRKTESADSIKIVPASETVFDKQALAEKLKKELDTDIKKERYDMLIRDIEYLENGVSVPSDRYLDYIYPVSSTLLDYFEGPIVMADSSSVMDSIKKAHEADESDKEILLGEGIIGENYSCFHLSEKEFIKKLNKQSLFYFESLPRSEFPISPEGVFSFSLKQLSPTATVAAICDDIPSDKRALTVVFAGERRTAEALTLQLNDNKINAVFIDKMPTAKSGIFVIPYFLSEGFEIPPARLVAVSYGRATFNKRKTKYKKGGNIGSLDELHLGDAVVHTVHGIGIFDGIRQIASKGIKQDYIRIKYRGTDVLYVPVTSLDLVSRYIGTNDEGKIKLNKLGSSEWTKTRTRVKSAVKNIAKQLTELYAKRMAVKGFSFNPDTDLQLDFERRFPYDETEDQLRCIEEIKRDMEANVPMDRLLCGDVGFGKTEVALRAAFKCILDGKQCAILVPTTILAWQHYNTALERFSGIPVNIEMISRFRTATQQTKIKKKLAEGNIDLIIGTHRLISSDIKFKDIGLLIVDEEQRFGVAQKEKLKEKFPSVDVLTLSATPIPRTLNMALSGLRDMSALEEAPSDRLPVQTYVLEYNKGILYEAINKELSRGGQVYYLHNRTESINSVALRLKQQFPDKNIGVAHGKMSEEELSRVWQQLLEREIDILVCTTIIETGVDVPNVNTLIIEDADRFGLSQLHQLRGRVGRSHRRAYAYFLFRRGKALSEISQKRLEAIREFTEFGSGYKIAMRDLELRGAGSVLGGEQHGHMETVGYEMYLRLLNDALLEEKGEKPTQSDCSIDIPSSARIPENYITDLSSRLEMYRRIASIRSNEDMLDVTDELIDRFGEPPKCVLELMEIALIKARCLPFGFTEVAERNSRLIITMKEPRKDLLLALYSLYSRRMEESSSEGERIIIKLKPEEKALETLKNLVSELENL